jgi:CDP-diacylglycerol--glycerol-3-phosphate 3-phosphatidyltransferase
MKTTLPNYITIFRMLLVPFLVAVLLTKFPEKEIVGCIIFSLAAITDYLDGYLARSKKQITSLGTLLDPLADKLLISAAFISLVELHKAPAWMVVIIVGREFAVTGLRMSALAEGFIIKASALGKYKTTVQVATIIILILGKQILGKLSILGVIGLWLTVALCLISGAHYLIQFWQEILPLLPKREKRIKKGSIQ